jgi:hypothetical protein
MLGTSMRVSGESPPNETDFLILMRDGGVACAPWDDD